MPTTLICRLSGHRTVIHQIPSGFGPTLWIGGFETDDGEPYITRYDTNTLPVREARAASTLAGLLAKLIELAPDAQHQPLSPKALRARAIRTAKLSARRSPKSRRNIGDAGHSEGTDPHFHPQSAR